MRSGKRYAHIITAVISRNTAITAVNGRLAIFAFSSISRNITEAIPVPNTVLIPAETAE